MENKIETPAKKRRKFSWTIQIITSLYGLLYLLFFIFSFIRSDTGNPVSDKMPFDPWDTEQIAVKILFIVFLIGFYYSWKSKMISGIIYFFWFMGLMGLGVYVSSVEHRDGGGALVMGFPILVISIILIIQALIRIRKQSS